jgi:hypothetical protein
MRLIDGDALDYALGASDEDIYCRYMLEDAPTIDAIPVEWLDDKFMDLQNKDKALSRAAWLVLHAWQKEQEAR